MAPNFPDVSERISHAYAQWQFHMMTSEISASNLFLHGDLDPAIRRACSMWDQFAEHLLDNSKPYSGADWYVTGDLNDNQIAPYVSLPAELANWSLYSRRSFAIPIELQAVFAAAEFPDVQWKDVLWPYNSFVLALEKPLRFVKLGGLAREYDAIMVHNHAGEGLVIRLLDKPKREGMSIKTTPTEIKKLRNMIADGELKEARRFVKRKQDRLSSLYKGEPGSTEGQFKFIGGRDAPVRIDPSDIYYCALQEKSERGYSGIGSFLDVIAHEAKGVVTWEETDPESRYNYEVMSVAAKIAISWMLYMESLPESKLQEKPFRQKRSMAGRVNDANSIITQPDRIFEIVGKASLGTSGCSKNVSSSPDPSKFVRPHWRRAHYRRPQGSAPDAEKTIRVPAVLVRPDLVPLYGLIAGTSTVMIAEK
jgi:hypothetical protein